MKIALVIHSKTGTSHGVGLKIQETLGAKGHQVNLIRLKTPDDGAMDPRQVTIENIPDLSAYEGIVFGAPVRAFSASAVIMAMIVSTVSLANKPVFCYVTEGFPFRWMGGNQAIAKMTAACSNKGAKLVGTGIVNRSNPSRKKQITDLVALAGHAF